MADDITTKQTTTEELSSSTKPSVEEIAKEQVLVDSNARVNGLETTTANDGSIPLNQGTEPTVKEITVAEEAPAITKEVASTPEVVLPEKTPAVESIVIKPEDVQSTEQPATDQLQERIEQLTGEIQALEAKIERLTSGTVAAPDAVAADEVATSEKPAAPEKPTIKEAPPVVPTSSTAPIPAAIPTMPNVNPVQDLYNTKSVSSAEPQEPRPSALGVIGEVLTILGMIVTILLAITPLFKELIGSDLQSVISSVGWLTAVITLGLGFLLSFAGAKAAIKLVAFIFLLIAGLMYVGISYPSLLGPLEDTLGSVFDFYR